MDFIDFRDNFIDQLEDYNGIEITKETLFRDLDDWDSLTGVAVQVMIADKYNAKIPDDEFLQVKTVGELFELTMEHKKSQ